MASGRAAGLTSAGKADEAKSEQERRNDLGYVEGLPPRRHHTHNPQGLTKPKYQENLMVLNPWFPEVLGSFHVQLHFVKASTIAVPNAAGFHLA
jgi:hypothetical protein